MILVIGGIASGKRTYVASLGYDKYQMSASVDDPSPVLVCLEQTLRDGPLSRDAYDQVLTKDVVVCLEVGAGVVPIDADERAWRELVGRTCCDLAQEADEVVRLVCGIPITLSRRSTL